MSPAPKKPDDDLTPEEIERAKARADEEFVAEEEAKVEEADVRETAKEIVEEEAAEELIAELDAADEEADARETAKELAEAEAEDAPAAEAEPEPEPAAEPEPEPAAEAAPDEPKRTRRRAANAQPEPAPKPAPKRRPAEPGVVVKAQAKYVRTSARKARLVCDHIRGKDVEQARAILAFTPRGAAEAWSKLLESAVANAEHNHELVGDELRIAAVHADEGPTLKRFRPRAMGRATKIRKRTSHLTITLTPKD